MRLLHFFIFIMCLVVISSCKKSDKQRNAIEGKWEMVMVTGGIGGVHLTGADLPYTQTYIFDNNGTFTWVFDAKTRTGHYTLGKDKLSGTTTEIDIVNLDAGVDYQYSFSHDTLVLNAYDHTDITYEWFVRR
ncbi:MAG: hypothetical protein KF744_04500 [Taibaiella sp.]|nr:hypothetical protein [Taibaiella sp.]